MGTPNAPLSRKIPMESTDWSEGRNEQYKMLDSDRSIKQGGLGRTGWNETTHMDGTDAPDTGIDTRKPSL